MNFEKIMNLFYLFVSLISLPHAWGYLMRVVRPLNFIHHNGVFEEDPDFKQIAYNYLSSKYKVNFVS